MAGASAARSRPLVSCDLAICADEAIFGLSEINWGIIPAGNVAKAFAEKVSPADAIYYMMTGDTFDGQKANAMRLVNDSVPRAQLREHTEALARKLMQKNPHVLWAVKDAGTPAQVDVLGRGRGISLRQGAGDLFDRSGTGPQEGHGPVSGGKVVPAGTEELPAGVTRYP